MDCCNIANGIEKLLKGKYECDKIRNWDVR